MCAHSRNVCESEFFHGTYGGLLLVVSELDSKLRGLGLGLRPGLVNVLCSLAKVFSLRVTLTIQENKWVLANFQESIMKCRGLSLCWIGIPSRGGTVILLVTSRNQEKLWGHLVWVQTLNFFFTWIWDITFQEIQFSWPPIVALCPSLIFKLCPFFSLQNYGTPWRHIWTSPAVWAIIVAHFCNNWGFYTFLTCLPSYFKEVLNFSISEVSLSYLITFFMSKLKYQLQLNKMEILH